jgi:hypothetical protein
MDEAAFNSYVWTISHNIFCHDRYFGALIGDWKFMLVTQPKVPFANDQFIPSMTFTYNFIDDATARRALNEISLKLYGWEYNFQENDFGQYLICYHE